MTTIACDGKSMSSDSLETAGDTIVGTNVKKIFRLDDGSIVGCAGRVSEITKFIDWLNDGDEDSNPPKGMKDMSALILFKDGTCRLFEDGVFIDNELPAATGTGHISALTAMDMGASTKKAVEMAIKRDVYSGGKVQTLTL